MKAVIVGGGKIGYNLLKTLSEKDYEVVLIEKDPMICQIIAQEATEEIICGDGSDIDVLKDAGIESAHVVAAVTGADENNLVVCEIAKRAFDITRTIARVNNPKNVEMFKALGVDRTVCSTQVIAQLIDYELDQDNFKIIQTFERGSMILVEVEIKKEMPWCENYLKDIVVPDECVVTSILRQDSAIYPRGNTRILEGDRLMVITNTKGLEEMKRYFHKGVRIYA